MKARVQVVKTAAGLGKLLEPWRRAGKRIGLVPTMGALHAGHLSLVRRAKKECGQVVVSIFVNPTQFRPGEDFSRYPRTLAADLKALAFLGPVLVFAPGVREMYPPGEATRVRVDGSLTEVLEGASRPGHFEGVATVVAKLFCLARPHRAYFGLKDFQQFRVIRRMARDLFLPLEVIGCPTVREADGLAMSSRNRYLSPPLRARAPVFYRALKHAAALAARGETSARRLEKAARGILASAGGFKVEYVSVADAETLRPLVKLRGRAVIAGAVRLGKTRLIDNIEVKP